MRFGLAIVDDDCQGPATDFEVDRRDFRHTRVIDTPAAELSAGQIRLAVERSAFTTNNVTYAAAGDMHVVRRSGPDRISAVYRELLEGQADPSVGHVVSMTPTWSGSTRQSMLRTTLPNVSLDSISS